ncbi:MAG: hypothetical protein JXR80_09095 [Deltaproteobacteria bacterium]|nr:hypothetical protein [Deltaproteobacteria bacterium]
MSLPSRLNRILPTIVLFLTIVISTAILYGPGLDYPFFFDDYNSLMNDQGQVSSMITSPAPALHDLRTYPLRPDRSLTWLSFAISYKLKQMSPAAFRIVNFGLHGLCSFLVYLIIALLLFRHIPATDPGAKRSNLSPICWPALFGALFFLCHPLALNTVLYISQRFGAQAAFFYLLGFYAWLMGRRRDSEISLSSRQVLWFLLAGISYWAALHSKEMAITLPLTITVYELYLRQPRPGDRKKLFWLGGMLFLTGAIFFLFAFKIGLFNQSWINIGFRSKRLWSPGIQFLSEARAFFHYWQMLFLPWPQSLSLHHEFLPSPGFSDPAALVAIMGHTILIAAAWKIRRHYPLAGYGILWFYLVLGPPYLFLPQRELLVEYKTYLAAPGAIMLIGNLMAVTLRRIESLHEKNKNRARAGLLLFSAGWLLALSTITWQRLPVFKNQITIWSDVLEKYPTSRRALNNRAVAHLKNKSPEGALNDLNTLVQNYPGYARGFENRGRLRLYLKDYRGAAADLQMTLKLLPDEPELKTTRNQIIRLYKMAREAAEKENFR